MMILRSLLLILLPIVSHGLAVGKASNSSSSASSFGKHKLTDKQYTRSKASSDVRTTNLASSAISWLSLSWLRAGDPYDYPQLSPNDLQQISGFSYCANLNNAVFDTNAPLRSNVVSVFLDELNSVSTHFDSNSLLYQYVLGRRMARMFSPTLDFEKMEHKVDEEWKRTTIRQIGPKNFARMIDFIAALLHKSVISNYILRPIQKDRFSDSFTSGPVDSDHAAKRFACYVAADGSNDWARLTFGRRKLLRFVDGNNYFENKVDYAPLNMTAVRMESNQIHEQASSYLMEEDFYQKDDQIIWPEKQPFKREGVPQLRKLLNSIAKNGQTPLHDPAGSRRVSKYSIRPHRIAYLILVHGKYESIVNLLEALIDPYVTILIHVDSKYPKLKAKLAKYLSSQSKRKNDYNRVKIMEQSFDCLWGYSSLVYAQLAGFFELLKMNNEWEYVINISGSDYPLRTNDVLYDDLKRYGNASFIDYWASLEAFSRVNDSPLFASEDNFAGQPISLNNTNYPIDINGVLYSYEKIRAVKEALFSQSLGYTSFPFSHWHVYKHSQWMILDRSFIESLRTSPTAIYVAAAMEWSMIPDESYFATVGLNSPSHKLRIVNDNKRYLQFPIGAPHPRRITPNDLSDLLDAVQNGVAFTRKINMEKADSWFLIYGIEKIRSWDHFQSKTN